MNAFASTRNGLLALGLILMAAGCSDDRRREDSPERRFQSEAAYRQACASQVLARTADEDLEILAAAAGGSDPGNALNQATTRAAFAYSQAYQRHAELRASAYALLDSAANHATTVADSARYIERAARFSLRMPEQGTVEANVLNSYQANISALLSDPNHPCNWDFPF